MASSAAAGSSRELGDVPDAPGVTGSGSVVAESVEMAVSQAPACGPAWDRKNAWELGGRCGTQHSLAEVCVEDSPRAPLLDRLASC